MREVLTERLSVLKAASGGEGAGEGGGDESRLRRVSGGCSERLEGGTGMGTSL